MLAARRRGRQLEAFSARRAWRHGPLTLMLAKGRIWGGAAREPRRSVYVNATVQRLPFAQFPHLARQQVGGLEAEVVAPADQLQRPFPVHETENALLQGFRGQAVRLAREQRRQAQHVSRPDGAVGQPGVAVVRAGGEAGLAAAHYQDTFSRLAPLVPDDRVKVAESGVGGPHDAARFAGEGADAVLVGEALVRGSDPRRAAYDLIAAGATP